MTNTPHTSRRILTRSIAAVLLAGSITPAMALNNLWEGDVSNDWNTIGNWSGGRIPIKINDPADFDDAVINFTGDGLTTFTPVIGLAGLAATPRDILVGTGGGTNGRLDQTAGTAQNGAGNWMFVGVAGGTGQFNLADTTTAGGTDTGFGLGTGSMNVGGRLYIGGRDNGGGGTGLLNVNTTGNLAMGGDFLVGASGGNGTMNLDAGTVTVGGWFMVAADHGGGNATGLVNQSGGSLTANPRVIVGHTGLGTYNLKGGTLTSNEEMWIGQGGIGNGTLNISAGATATSNSWLAVGREGSDGVINNSGSLVKNSNNDNNVVLGTGTGGVGTINNEAGATFTTGDSDMWVGENASGNGTLNVNGGTVTTDELQVGRTDSANGFVNVKPGGTLNARTVILAFNNEDAAPEVVEQANGTVNQTGGNFNIAQNLDVQGVAGNGSFNLSGGTLSVDGAIDATNGTFSFTGGRLTRSNGGLIDFNGDLAVLEGDAGFILEPGKTFDISGAFNVTFGLTFDLAGVVIPDDNGISPFQGSILLGHVGSLIDTGTAGFETATTTVTGLVNNPSATFIDEGAAFDPASQSVYWVDYDSGTGNVSLQYNVVPEPTTALLLGVAGVGLALRRRRK